MILPRLRKKSPTLEKEMIPSAKKNNKLHVTTTLNEKEAGIKPRSDYVSDGHQPLRGTPASEIRIADLIADVKDDSGSFFKYLPDSMLNEARIESKNVAIAEDEERIAGMRQEYAEDKKAKETAQKMGRNGQRGFFDTYKGETVRAVAPRDATAGYRAVYNATIENRAMTEAEAQAAAKIPDTMVKAAENAARGTVLVRVGKSDYIGDVVVATTKGNEMEMYDIVNILPTNIKEKNPSQTAATSNTGISHRTSTTGSKQTLLQTNGGVNSQYMQPTKNNTPKTFSQADTDMYKQLLEEFGAIEPGENPSRDVQVPKNFLEII